VGRRTSSQELMRLGKGSEDQQFDCFRDEVSFQFLNPLMPPQRLIRRQPLIQRLSSFPQDLLLSLNERYELLEWDSLSDSLSIPNGITLNLIYLLARLDQSPTKTTYHDKAVFQGSRIRDSGVFLGKTGDIHTIVRNPSRFFAIMRLTFA